LSRLVIAPIAAVLALTGCSATPGAPTTGTAASSAAASAGSTPAAATTGAAPTQRATTSPATTKPATPEPATTKPATTKPATTKPATTKPLAASGCPVKAATLNAIPVPGYSPKEIEVIAAGIICVNGWAQADPGIEGGDGVILYRYDAGSGAWKFATEGSSIDCGELGIPRATGKKLTVCYYQ
jgi:hypothetical protein